MNARSLLTGSIRAALPLIVLFLMHSAAGAQNYTPAEADCYSRVQGRVAYDQNGSVSWYEPNARALCRGTTNPTATIACFTNIIRLYNDWNRGVRECAGPTVGGTTGTGDASGNTPLHAAVRTGNISSVEALINQGQNVNARNNAGETPVSIAAGLRNAQMLRLLISRGGDLNVAVDQLITARDEQSLRSLAFEFPVRFTNQQYENAINAGAFGIAEIAIDKGVESNFALTTALRLGARQLIEPALRAGANADPALKFGMERGDSALAYLALSRYNANPDLGLSLAVSKNDLSILQLALSRGANANSAMPAAARSGNSAMVSALLDGRADPNSGLLPAIESNQRTIVEMLINRGANPSLAMPYAVRSNDLNLVRMLLDKRASASDPALMSAAAANRNIQMIEILLAAGADPSSGMESAITANSFEITKFLIEKNARAGDGRFIVIAARNGNRQIVDLLLEKGASVDSGLSGAVEGGKADLVDYFIKKNANSKNPELMTTAGRVSNPSVIELLLAAGASAEPGIGEAVRGALAGGNSPDRMRSIELLIKGGASVSAPDFIINAVSTSNSPLAAVLLNNGAPKDAMDNLGQPLVHIAALTWNPQIVATILALGVDPNAKNRAGDTALHIVADDEASVGYPKFREKKKERIPTLNALIAGKADVNASNARGEFVLKRADGGDVKDILKAAGAVQDQKELNKRGGRPNQ